MSNSQHEQHDLTSTHDVYLRMLIVADFFITKSATLNLNMAKLQAMNPNAREMAKILRNLANILNVLAGNSYDDTNMAINALQCCLIMEQIADAIAEEDAPLVEQLLLSLEKHVNAPIPV